MLHAAITEPSNWRANRRFDGWLKAGSIVGICGVDTRALTALIRDNGMPNAILAHRPDGVLRSRAAEGGSRRPADIARLDLVPLVASAQRYEWDETPWRWPVGYGERDKAAHKVITMDYGVKRNILRLLAKAGCEVTVVPSTASAEDILALQPDGVFLSNGPAAQLVRRLCRCRSSRALLDRKTPDLRHLPRPPDDGAERSAAGP